MLSIKKFSPNYSKHAFAGVLVLSLSCQCYKNTWKTFVYTKIVQAFFIIRSWLFLNVLQNRTFKKFLKISRHLRKTNCVKVSSN